MSYECVFLHVSVLPLDFLKILSVISREGLLPAYRVWIYCLKLLPDWMLLIIKRLKVVWDNSTPVSFKFVLGY